MQYNIMYFNFYGLLTLTHEFTVATPSATPSLPLNAD